MIFFRLLRIISHVLTGVVRQGNGTWRKKRVGWWEREKKYIDRNSAEELLQQRFSKNILFKLNKCLFVKNATTRCEGCLPVSVFLSFLFIYLHAPCLLCHLKCAELAVRFRADFLHVVFYFFFCNSVPLSVSSSPSLHLSVALPCDVTISVWIIRISVFSQWQKAHD